MRAAALVSAAVLATACAAPADSSSEPVDPELAACEDIYNAMKGFEEGDFTKREALLLIDGAGASVITHNEQMGAIVAAMSVAIETNDYDVFMESGTMLANYCTEVVGWE